MWFELYKDSCRQTKEPWRWRLRDSDETVLAVSTKGYPDEDTCRSAILLLNAISLTTPMMTRPRARSAVVHTLFKRNG
jgi:uncharacterized protein YegP (UPF0339 family)